MKKTIFLLISLITIILFFRSFSFQSKHTGAPPYIDNEIGNDNMKYPDLSNWKRPDGPLRVGLQVGHWKSNELPEELERLRGNSGAQGYGITETDLNYLIAENTAKILKEKGIVVDILPATIPPGYIADVFIAIHADGHSDTSKTGFKAAGPRRDYSGKAEKMVSLLKQIYSEKTDLVWDEESITRNMRGYYAFSWWRFEHATHPMTPAVILETGFLSNPAEAEFLFNNPEIPADAIAESVLKFLELS